MASEQEKVALRQPVQAQVNPTPRARVQRPYSPVSQGIQTGAAQGGSRIANLAQKANKSTHIAQMKGYAGIANNRNHSPQQQVRPLQYGIQSQPVIQAQFQIKNGGNYAEAASLRGRKASIMTAIATAGIDIPFDEIFEMLCNMAQDPEDHGVMTWLEAVQQAVAFIGPGEVVPMDTINHMNYDSDDDAPSTYAAHSKLRRSASAEGWKALVGEGVMSSEDYRTGRVTATLDTGYTFQSGPASNFVTGKGFSGKNSDYDSIIGSLREYGLADAEISNLMLMGLYDFPQLQEYLQGLKVDKQKNQIQFFLALLVNEILGRSAANLVEITLILRKTHEDGGDLLDRFNRRGVFMPNGKLHHTIGGQKLSRIGTAAVSEKDLDADLRGVVSGNSSMWNSFSAQNEAETPTETLEELKVIFAQFAKNIHAHIRLA